MGFKIEAYIRLVVVAVTTLFFFSLTVHAGAAPQTGTTSPRVCNGIASCNLRGAEALRKGDNAAALGCFKAQVGYAEDARNVTQTLVAYNNMSVTYLSSRDYLRAAIWARLALHTDPANKGARYNLKVVQEHMGAHKWPADVSGAYVRYAGSAHWDSLCVAEAESQRVHARLLVFRMGEDWREYGPASYGDLDCEAQLAANGHAQCRGDDDFPECSIPMKFGGGTVILRQEGDCGFGYGVDATGTFERIDTTKRSPEECRKGDLADEPAAPIH
jgi:hypothetical protein